MIILVRNGSLDIGHAGPGKTGICGGIPLAFLYLQGKLRVVQVGLTSPTIV